MSTHKIKTAVKALHTFGQENGHRITEPREYALEIIAAAKKPLTAYDILDHLSKKLDKPKPPTAYRALEFLMLHGFIHRIESLNAYVTCAEDHKHHGSQFMICDSCGQAEEIHLCHAPESLMKQSKEKGFTLSHWNAELHGLCKNCQ